MVLAYRYQTRQALYGNPLHGVERLNSVCVSYASSLILFRIHYMELKAIPSSINAFRQLYGGYSLESITWS